MKRLEKMAQEAARDYRHHDGHRPDFEAFEAYLAGYEQGFKAAREMAYELMAKGDPRCFGLDVDMVNLGEDEVDD